ncbi:sulfite exporter TauE/SafE family protein [Thermaurantiacus sp.]
MPWPATGVAVDFLGPAFLVFMAVGFGAQMIDSALGGGFGVISSSFLLSNGVPPVSVSAGIHAVKCVTAPISGVSHVMAGNIDWSLFRRIAGPGVLGAILGAYVLSGLPPHIAKPLILGYLVSLGVVLLLRDIRHKPLLQRPPVAAPLAVAAGFFDSTGGGGWGPIMTPNLIIQGSSPRHTIGTVNLAEFFVAIASSVTFLATMGAEIFVGAILGLLLGAVFGAPVGAMLTKYIPARYLMRLVALLLIGSGAYGIITALA